MSVHTLYRACSPAEVEAMLAAGRFVFATRAKFFSPSLAFIAARVRDGAFGGAHAAHDAYDEVFAFAFTPAEARLFVRMNPMEWRLDRWAAAYTPLRARPVGAPLMRAALYAFAWETARL